MKTTYYYIQEKYPAPQWRTVAIIGSLPNVREARKWLTAMREEAKGLNVKVLYRILKVTEEVL